MTDYGENEPRAPEPEKDLAPREESTSDAPRPMEPDSPEPMGRGGGAPRHEPVSGAPGDGAFAPPSPPVKTRILQRFEAWLDEALAEESLPDGIASEILSEIEREASIEDESPSRKEADLYSLWASVTALTQEVRLQGRAFKGLNDSLSPFLDWVSSSQDRAVREAERRVRRESLEVLVDLRDRLARGADLASERLREVELSSATPWTARLFRRRPDRRRSAVEAVEALERGYRMSLDRLDEVLDRLGVREIDCEGQVFDPHCMTAIEIEETLGVDAGEVVEVYRTGYEWNDEVFRAAEVKVARAPRPRPQGGET